MTTPNTTHDIVIVGAGIAGINAATTALSGSDTASVLLLNGEAWAPYDRPPLSKDVLLGKVTPGGFDLMTAETLNDPRLTMIDGLSVTTLDPAGKALQLSDGRTLGYGRLILATGARARPLAPEMLGPGTEAAIVYLRTMDDALRLKAALSGDAPKRVIVIGAGYIGLEVAASAGAHGCPVTVIELGDRVLARNAPTIVSDFMRRQHEAHGVTLRFGTAVRGIAAQADGMTVTLTDGSTVAGDVVVVGIGAVPNDDLARDAGIACDNGILIDDRCRTSAADVFAIGDVARLHSAGGPSIRYEHWNAARLMGTVAGANATGADTAFSTIPWVWSDQFNFNLQFIGATGSQETQILRGDPVGGKWAVLDMDGDVIVGATLVNLGKERRLLEQMIRDRLVVDRNGLMDAKTALKSLLPVVSR